MGLRPVVGAAGLVVTLLAVGFVLAPDSVRSIRPVAVAVSALPTDNPKSLLLGLGFLVGLGATVLSRSGGGRGIGGDPLVEQPPEAVYSTGRVRPGSAFDRRLDRGEDETAIRQTLRETATDTLVKQAGVDPPQARRAVQTGVWTRDPVVAAFLGTPRQPLLTRIRGWLDPDGERRRRVERTVAAIEGIDGDRR